MTRVWVVGSVNADLVVRTDRLPLPGETVSGSSVDHGLGGKGANQAVAAARMDAAVSFVGAVGDDEEGTGLRNTLGAEGIDVDHVAVVPGPSGLAIVLVDGTGENSIVVISGANAAVTPTLAGGFDALGIAPGDIVVTQGELPVATTVAALGAARDAGARTVWNPAPAIAAQREHLALADVVVVNETELALLARDDTPGAEAAGDGPADAADPIEAGLLAVAHRSAGDVIVTLGADGVVALAGGGWVEVPVRPAQVVDTTGAGDCFVGVLVAAMAAGRAIPDAIGVAVVASSLAVQRSGASSSMPTAAEVASAVPTP